MDNRVKCWGDEHWGMLWKHGIIGFVWTAGIPLFVLVLMCAFGSFLFCADEQLVLT